MLDLSYKMYDRPHPDYGDVIFHTQRADLMKLIERVQYKAALIVSGCSQGARRNYMTNLVGSRCLTEDGFVICPSFAKHPMVLPHLTYQITSLNEM